MALLKYSRPIGTDKRRRAFVVSRKVWISIALFMFHFCLDWRNHGNRETVERATKERTNARKEAVAEAQIESEFYGLIF
jgi:hypothetical protein